MDTLYKMTKQDAERLVASGKMECTLFNEDNTWGVLVDVPFDGEFLNRMNAFEAIMDEVGVERLPHS